MRPIAAKSGRVALLRDSDERQLVPTTPKRHFIVCTWGGCYNGIYRNCLAPFLDSPEVVDSAGMPCGRIGEAVLPFQELNPWSR